MLPFEAIEAPVRPPAFRPATRPPLPLYVEPAPEEALLSWLLRLATRLGISLHALASESFGIDDREGRTFWWCRPHPWLLARISEQTGVSVTQLRRMTFERFEPIYRDDEAKGRFTGRRYDTAQPDWRRFSFAACGDCLEGGATPYLRTPWLLGWMAVCPEHHSVLITRCWSCHAGLRVASFATAAAFSPVTCTRCGARLLASERVSAHPSVARIQAALLRGKCEGSTELAGIGPLTWKEMVALADVLIGMVWTDTTLAEREQIAFLYQFEIPEEPRAETRIYDSRHDSLSFLAWLTEGWPDSVGATVAIDMLKRWATGERNRLSRHLGGRWAYVWSPGSSGFEPAIEQRLLDLIKGRKRKGRRRVVRMIREVPIV